jgi:hypothetical protein
MSVDVFRTWTIVLNYVLCQPHNTRWISPAERRLAQARLSEDAGEADKDNAEDSYVCVNIGRQMAHVGLHSPMEGLKMAIRDPIVLLFALMTIAQLLGLSFVQFFPT